jgi:hypothetical protein
MLQQKSMIPWRISSKVFSRRDCIYDELGGDATSSDETAKTTNFLAM